MNVIGDPFYWTGLITIIAVDRLCFSHPFDDLDRLAEEERYSRAAMVKFVAFIARPILPAECLDRLYAELRVAVLAATVVDALDIALLICAIACWLAYPKIRDEDFSVLVRIFRAMWRYLFYIDHIVRA
jgi:hypothetical protein